MATTAVFNTGAFENMNKSFFLKTKIMIDAKLYMKCAIKLTLFKWVRKM
jgi:hypothetical protein